MTSHWLKHCLDNTCNIDEINKIIIITTFCVLLTVILQWQTNDCSIRVLDFTYNLQCIPDVENLRENSTIHREHLYYPPRTLIDSFLSFWVEGMLLAVCKYHLPKWPLTIEFIVHARRIDLYSVHCVHDANSNLAAWCYSELQYFTTSSIL